MNISQPTSLCDIDPVVRVFPESVQYSWRGPGGMKFVEIYTKSLTPRFSAWYTPYGTLDREPVTFFKDEILWFFNDAMERSRK